MERKRLKEIVRQLKEVVSEIESEVWSNTDAYIHPWYKHTGDGPQVGPAEDDDGYPD